MKRIRVSTKIYRAVGAAIGALVLLGILYVLAQVWTDYLWYRSMGQQAVFTTKITAQALVWIAFSAAAFVILLIPALAARRIVGRSTLSSGLAYWGAGIFAIFSGWNMSGSWMVFRMAVSQPAFGITDPQFGNDVAFYVFRLPALELLSGWLTGLVVLSAVLALGVVFLPVWSGMAETTQGQWQRLKSLLMRLTGVLMLAGALGFRVSIWSLVLSTRTAQTGASYTDVHAQLPADWIMLGLSVTAALVFFVMASSRRWKTPVIAVVTWLLALVLVGNAWPSVMQTYVVAPNEASLELPYIERNIQMTGVAFDLAATDSTSYDVEPSLTATKAASVEGVLANARLWTPETVAPAYEQLQTIRPYYKLSDIETDRYEVDGQHTEVLVSAREIDTSSLPERARTWVNEHLVYTHGCGLAISSVSGATERGFPVFLVGDVLPKVAEEIATDSPSLETTEPRIYFGANTSGYVVVNTGIDEFDYPDGEHNATCRYAADSGVRVGGLAERLAWAVRLGSDQLLFSEYITPDSRVLLYRDVKKRAAKIAPWLDYAETAYPALVDGRIVWILDAYTSSDHFPYAQSASSEVNYLRNSVKVVVDAYTGGITFYANGEDPVRDAWADIFPTVITPASEVGDALAAHFRYPQALFDAQAEMYLTYHMTDATVFYNKEDQWQTFGDDELGASYLTLEMPDGVEGEGFYLMQAFAPANRDNMIGLVAAACEPEGYGQRTAYLLPKDRVILGPEQVIAQINQDPEISPQLSLWDQRGSNVMFGELLVLPLEGSVVYVQPIFLQADNAAITELVGVVVVNGDRVEIAPTLAEALELTFAQ